MVVQFYNSVNAACTNAERLSYNAGGGIGGGGVLVPLYILCWGFATEHAVALSNLTIAGGAFANLWCNIGRYVLMHILVSAALSLHRSG